MDLNALMERVKQQKAAVDARKAGGASLLKFPQGTSRWRILPGWRPNEPQTFSHDFGAHWIKDEAGKVVAVYVCDWDTFGKPCDFCAPLREALKATKDDAMVKALKELTSRKQVLVNAVQTAGPGADPTKVGLLGMPVGVADAFINLLFQRLSDDINLLDLQKGRELIVERTGAGLNTRYSVSDGAKDFPLDPALMTQVTDIDAWIKNQRDSGLSKGVAPLNSAIARALSAGGATGARSPSLVSGAGVAAAAAAASYGGGALGAPATTPAALATTTTSVEETVVTEKVSDSELEQLLQSLDN